MKLLIVLAIVGLLVVAGFVAVSAINSEEPVKSDSPLSCSSCGNSCTAESNCGRATCGAVSGTGSCGCNG